MLTLPADIKLLILDHIDCKADLRALYYVSRAGRELVLPRLYRHINLITWDPGQKQLRCFVRCMSAGAGLHLRFTRVLTFETERPPPLQHQLDGAKDFTADIVDSFILVLLEMFPEHGLRKFGYARSFHHFHPGSITKHICKQVYLSFSHLTADHGMSHGEATELDTDANQLRRTGKKRHEFDVSGLPTTFQTASRPGRIHHRIIGNEFSNSRIGILQSTP